MQHRVSPPKLRRLGGNLAALAVGAGHPIIDEAERQLRAFGDDLTRARAAGLSDARCGWAASIPARC